MSYWSAKTDIFSSHTVTRGERQREREKKKIERKKDGTQSQNVKAVEFNKEPFCRPDFCLSTWREQGGNILKNTSAEKSKCQGFPQNKRTLKMLSRPSASRCPHRWVKVCLVQRLKEKKIPTCQACYRKKKEKNTYSLQIQGEEALVWQTGVYRKKNRKEKGGGGLSEDNLASDFRAANQHSLSHERHKEAKQIKETKKSGDEHSWQCHISPFFMVY